MTWIKFDLSTPDKPEVWQIADALTIEPDAVIGKLLRIWAWFDQHTKDGNASSVSVSFLDRLVSATGFCKTMILVGWMIDDGITISLPNFDRHNGTTAKTRALTAKRVSNHRKTCNPGANESVTDNTLPEKKREEKKLRRRKPSSVVKSKRPKDQATDEWDVPSNLDSTDVRSRLEQFEAMRQRIKKPIKSRRDASVILPRFDDREHLLYALDTCIANEYQGLKPDYRPTKQVGPTELPPLKMASKPRQVTE